MKLKFLIGLKLVLLFSTKTFSLAPAINGMNFTPTRFDLISRIKDSFAAQAAGNSTLLTSRDSPVTNEVLNAYGSCSLTVDLGSDTTFCRNLVGTVSLNASVTGASNVSYLWSPNNETTPFINVSPTTTTTYSVLVTDLDQPGCSASASVTINVNPNPSIGIAVTDPLTSDPEDPSALCAGQSVDLTATSGYASYVWTKDGATLTYPSSTTIINVDSAGYYSVIVTDGNGCTDTTGIPIVNFTISITGMTAITCKPATLTASGGVSWLWSDGSTSQTITVDNPGNYSVTATDANGCTATASVMVPIIDRARPYITPSGSTTFCSGGNVTLTSSPGESYLWSDSSTSQSITVSVSGTYYVRITDAFGCVAMADISVYESPAFAIDITGMTYITCNPATLSSSGGVSWLWSDGSTTQTITVNNPGNYSVTATDANGCTATASVFVPVVDQAPAFITPSGSTTLCSGGNVTLTSSPGASYLWSDSSTSQSITVSVSGTYSVRITDTNGCVAMASIDVNAYPSFDISITGTTYITCNPATLSSTGGVSWLWSDGSTTQSITVNMPGNYSVTATDVNGCTATASIVVPVVDQAPAFITPGGPTAFCAGGNVSLTSSPGESYLWSDGSISQSITVSVSGTYFVIITDINGCLATASISVSVSPVPAPPAIASLNPVCQNSMVVVTFPATGLMWYSQPTGGTGSSTPPTFNTNTVDTTNYYVSVAASGSNCESDRTLFQFIVVAQPDPPAVSTPITYCQNATALALTATGIGLRWYPGPVGGNSIGIPTPSTSAVGSTTYYVSQTDNGCESERASIEVIVNAVPSAPVVSSPVTYCRNMTASPLEATGSSLLWYINSSGGIGSTTAPTPVTSTLGTTPYYVSQTENGCESPRATISVVVTSTVTQAPVVTTPFVYCLNASASALTATGTSLLWYNSSNGGIGSSAEPTPLTTSAGNTNYFVSQTKNGCESARAMITVTVNPLPAAPISASGPTSFPIGGSVTLNTSSINTYSYKWFIGTTQVGTGSSYTATTGGDYTVEVKDNGTGCKANSSIITVTVGLTSVHGFSGIEEVASIYPIPANKLVYIETNLELTSATFRMIDALGADVNVLFTVNGKDANADVSFLPEGVYTVLITKENHIIRKKIIIIH